MLLFTKKWRILISISLLTMVTDDIDASVYEGVTDSNLRMMWIMVHDDIDASFYKEVKDSN